MPPLRNAQGLRPTVLTTQVHTVQTRVGPAAQSAQVDTEMSAPHEVNAPDLTTNNGPHEADVPMDDQIPSQACLLSPSDAADE